MDLSSDFWNNRYLTGETGWDLGGASAPLKSFFDSLEDKTIKILIPGAGNAYEAEYLFAKGFRNIYVADFSPKACEQFGKRVPDFPKDQILCLNFFDLEGKYDLIIEQTFFCAIDPVLREQYARKMIDLLNPEGKLVGLLFNDNLNADQPPFGGCLQDYRELFSKYFQIEKLEPCHNSIEPRAGRELFFTFRKAKAER